jgi:hypothetical protein
MLYLPGKKNESFLIDVRVVARCVFMD